MKDNLITIPQIAKELKTPVSNIRYYVRTFSNFFTPLGEGRYKSYTLDALDKISIILNCMKKAYTHSQIENALIQEGFTPVLDVEEEGTVIPHTEPMPQESLYLPLKKIAEQYDDILKGQGELKKTTLFLSEENRQQIQLIEQLAEQNKILLEQNEQMKAELAKEIEKHFQKQENRSGFLSRLFRSH